MPRLSGKIAIVTGGASGIGRACATRLAAEGAATIVADIDSAGAEETCRAIRAEGGKAEFHPLDVTDEAGWANLIALTGKRYGGLHVLVNNAAICVSMPLGDTTLDLWRRTLAINLESVFLGTKAAVPPMAKSGGGSIINISSAAGICGVPSLTAYCASKGGVRLFTKAAALECAYARNNVRINSVHPGGVETPIWVKMANDGAMPDWSTNSIAQRMEEARVSTVAVTPMGRAAQPAEIAAGVLYLASDDSSYVTGTELVIDGGVLAS